MLPNATLNPEHYTIYIASSQLTARHMRLMILTGLTLHVAVSLGQRVWPLCGHAFSFLNDGEMACGRGTV